MKPIASIALFAVMASPALAQTPPPTAPPAALTKDMMTLAVQCSEAGGKYGRSLGMIKVADLNGDGQRDYVIDINHYNCEGAASAMAAGQSGAAVMVYIGGPGNTARKAWDDLAYETEIKTVGGKARLWLTLQGGECGQKNAASLPMSDQKGCERPLNWNAATAKFVLAPLSEAKGF